MKNILLKTLFPIQTLEGSFGHVGTHTRDIYMEMQDLSIHSHRRYLEGDWELIDIRQPPQRTITDAFRYTARLTQEIYLEHGGACRILYTDPDTIMHRPLDIWGRFGEFRLFDDKQFGHPDHVDLYSCCVRYFPENLDQNFWQLMNTHLDVTWQDGVYDYEMGMYRTLLFSQNINQELKQDDIWAERSVYTHNAVDRENIPQSIIHLGGSGNLDRALDIMRELVEV